jgi:predicted  nucleic acid-binding Zn-ribbon protein
MMCSRDILVSMLAVAITVSATITIEAQDPLRTQIDKAVSASQSGATSAIASDGAFMRRVYLDLVGIIPSAAQARAFIDDQDPQKRQKLVDGLISSPQMNRNLAVTFDLILMERVADSQVKTPEWRQYLYDSFATDKPYNQMVSEILLADGADDATRVRSKFFLERDVEPNRMTRDISRIFLGMDLQCAQCHNHPLVDHFYQADYYGVFAFVNRSFLYVDKNKKEFVGEKSDGAVSFKSVFTDVAGVTGPRLPGDNPIAEPVVAGGEDYKVVQTDTTRPIPTHSRRSLLSAEMTSGKNIAFNRNIANRLWAHMLGRGVVHPLDMHHPDNPPSNPKLMDVLATAVVTSGFNVKTILREIALSETYQRAIELADGEAAPAIAAIDTRITELTAQQKTLVESSTQLYSQWEDLGAQIEEIRTKHAEVKKQFDAADAALNDAANKLRGGQAALATSQANLTAKKDPFDAFDAAAKSAEAALAKLPDEASIKEAAAKFRARADQLKPEVDKFTAEVAAKMKELEAFQVTYNEKKTAFDPTVKPWTDAQQEIHNAQVNRQGIRNQYDTQYAASRLAIQQIAELQKQREIAVLQDTIASKQNQVASLIKQTAEAQSKRDQLAKEIPPVEKTVADQKGLADVATAEVAALKPTLDSQTEASKLVADASAKAEAVRVKLPEDKEVIALADGLKTRNAELAETLKVTTVKMTELQTKQSAATKVLTETQTKLAAMKSDMDKVTALIPELATQKQTAESVIATSTATLQEKLDEQFDVKLVQYAVADIKNIGPEAFAWSLMEATGIIDAQRNAVVAELDKNSPLSDADKQDSAKLAARDMAIEKGVHAKLVGVENEFIGLYANAAGQPQDEFISTVDQALFFSNGGRVRGWLNPSGGNLVDRLLKTEESGALANELYLAVFTRYPSEPEVARVTQYLADRGDQRTEAVQEMVWALLASAEFRFNH